MNGKVNTPIEFSYRTALIDGYKVALITIAMQSRPIYLKKKFGKLLANTVYLRRGSSTAIALPEEIAKMGVSDTVKAVETPVISTFIVSGEHDELSSNEHTDNISIVHIPPLSEFPIYSSVDSNQRYSDILLRNSINKDNPNYYSEFAKYYQQSKRTSFLKFGIENTGNKVARDLRAVIEFEGLPVGTELIYPRKLLGRPVKQESILSINPLGFAPQIYSMDISTTATGYKVEIDFGKVQAKDSKICNESLCLLASKEFQIKIQVKVFSDDLSEPSSSELLIDIIAEHEEYKVSDFTRI